MCGFESLRRHLSELRESLRPPALFLLRGIDPSLPCTAVKSAEVFYLLIDGGERGPYTVAQIDHLLNSGLIPEQTLFWREGMEQWTAVTDLVKRREAPKRNWIRTGILAGILVLLLILTRVFGPTALMGWREASQAEFTPVAAYWRARDAVRSQALPSGAVVLFHGVKAASVKLEAGAAGEVILKGDVTKARGVAQTITWKVQLAYDRRFKQWSGTKVQQIDPIP